MSKLTRVAMPFVLVLSTSAASLGQEGGGAEQLDVEGARIARELEGPDGESLARRLSALRPLPVAGLFELACTGSVPARWLVPPAGPRPLGPEERGAVAAALRGAPLALLRPTLDAVAGSPDWHRRGTAIDLLGDADDPRALLALLDVARPADSPEGEGIVPPAARRRFGEAARRLLAAHPEALRLLAESVESVHPGLALELLRAVEPCPPDAVLALLGRWLGVRAELDPLLLGFVARAARRGQRPFDEAVRARVRWLLDGPVGETTLRGAVVAAGALGDDEAIGELIALLAGGDDVRPLAADALRDVTGLGFGTDPSRWRRWYEEERAWWEREAGGCLADLRSGRPEQAMRAMRLFSLRRTRREEVVEAMVLALGRREEDVRLAALASLARIPSRSALEVLRAVARQGADPELRAAAEKALGASSAPPSGRAPGRGEAPLKSSSPNTERHPGSPTPPRPERR